MLQSDTSHLIGAKIKICVASHGLLTGSVSVVLCFEIFALTSHFHHKHLQSSNVVFHLGILLGCLLQQKGLI